MLNINLEWDANALNAPQSFRDGITAAANVLEAAIFNPITVNVSVGYGEIESNGSVYQTLSGDASFGGTSREIQVSYPALRDALAANETSAEDTEAVNALPNATSLDGQSDFAISPAEAKAWGALPATDPSIDGNVGFPTTFTGNFLVNAAITELMHAMGLITDGGILGLFQYTSPGIHFLPQQITASTPAYFSIDGGNTALANYDVSIDETLFLDQSNDPLATPAAGATALTSLDLTEISVIGFDDTSTASLHRTPTVSLPTTTSNSQATLTVQDVTVPYNTSIPVSALISSVSVPTGHAISSYGFYDQGGDGGYFSINGVREPDDHWTDVLDTQLGSLYYVAGSSAGKEVLEVVPYDNTANTFTQGGLLTATTEGSAGTTGGTGTTGATTASSLIGNGTVLPGNGGADTVISLSGNSTVTTTSTGAFVFLGEGAASVTSLGADTVVGGTGATTVSAATSSPLVFSPGGPLDFIAGGGVSTVVAGSVSTTLFGGSGNTLLFSNGPTQYFGGGGVDTVVGLNGALTVQAGAGGGVFFGGTAGNNIITAGAGNVTAFGGGAGDVLTATGAASDLFAGGLGAETLTGAGSTGANTFFAGFGNETLIGGAGNTALVAGAGADLLTAGTGPTLFLFVNGRTSGAVDTISGFDATHDFVKLAGYGTSTASVLQNAMVANGSSTIMLSDGTKVIFAGVTHFSASSFT